MDTVSRDMEATAVVELDPVDPPTPVRPRPGTRKLVVRLVVMVLFLTLVLGGLYQFDQFRKKMIAQYFAGNVPPPSAVSAALATAEPLPRYLEGIGTVAAVHQVTVAPEAAGRVTEILFEAGASVVAGQPLLQLNDAPDRADLDNYRAQERYALASLDRSKSLAAKNFGTQQNVDLTQSQLDTARAGIARAQAVIAQKQVRAPFAGQLGIRQIEVGQYLNAGTPIVTLTDLDRLYVNFTLPEQARSALKVGQPVAFLVDGFPDRRFAATVTTIEPQIDAGTRSLKVQASLTNPNHLLLPGMFAAVKVALPEQPGVVMVPETAVDYTAYGESLYRIVAEGTGADGKPRLKATQLFVKAGPRHDGKVAIFDGLAAGDRVVTAGQIKLHNGAAVTVVDGNALTQPATPPVN